VGESRAGHPFNGRLAAGEAVLISTGAEIPDGCERVVVKEDARICADTLHIERLGGKPHIRLRGSDFAVGEVLLEAGRRLRAGEIALAAAAGFGAVTVARRPLAAILCTGDELLALGSPPERGRIYDSNGVMLAAMVEAAGGRALRSPPIADTPGAIVKAVMDAEADIVIVVGGASNGAHDHCRASLTGIGLRVDVPGLLMKPGKPFWSGMLPDGRRIVGLPGNPATAFVCAHLFVPPLLALHQGRRPDQFIPVAVVNPPPPSDSERWRFGCFERVETGLQAILLAEYDSASTTSLAAAELIVRIPAGVTHSRVSDAIAV
jgi:molybdopterin molybdotransferase